MTRSAARRRGGAERPAAGPPRAEPVAEPQQKAQKPPAARTPVDPAVYRRRRRLALLFAALALLVVLGLGARSLLFDAGLFDVEDVQVAGVVSVPVADVLTAAGVPPGTPLAGVDTGGVATRVGALPGVASVEVGLSWPHTVTVAVVERVPVGTVDTPDGPVLVDRSGVVYRAPVPPGLPRMEVSPSSGDPATRAAVTVLAGLPDAVRTQVVNVRATVAVPGAPAQVTLGLDGGREVRWGDRDRVTEKGAVLVALLTQPGHVYDVTSPDLPTIRR